jgi:solute carrier family 25 folate transporter 32
MGRRADGSAQDIYGAAEAGRRPPRAPVRGQAHLIAGTTGGLVATVICYPLDTIKTRFQAHTSATTYSPYASVATAFRTIIGREGWRALYQGLGPAMVGAGASWGGYFYFYEKIKDQMKARAPAGGLGMGHHITAGMLAGNAIVLMTNPVWLIKTRLQLQMKEPGSAAKHYRGFGDAVVTIVREEGPLALYRGLAPALLLCGQAATQVAIYEWMKGLLPGHGTPVESMLMGGSSKIIASIILYPQQVIKTRMQDRRHAGLPVSLRSEATAVYREHGLRGFFRGCVPYALKTAPAAAVTFVVYEETMHLLAQPGSLLLSCLAP